MAIPRLHGHISWLHCYDHLPVGLRTYVGSVVRGQLAGQPSECQRAAARVLLLRGPFSIKHSDDVRVMVPVFIINVSASIVCNDFCLFPTSWSFSLANGSQAQLVSINISCDGLVRTFLSWETNLNV